MANSFEEKEIAKNTGKPYGPRDGSALQRSFDKMNNITYTLTQKCGLQKLFETAYLIAWKGRPYTDFKDLIELQNLHGVDFLPNNTYVNETACRDFVNFSSDAIFKMDLQDKLKSTNFVSILCDGSTDSAIVEKECIYVLYVDPESFQPTLSFLSLKSLTSQDAEGLFQAIKNALEEKGLSELWEKLVFLCSDGASVNSGLKAGLINKIKEELPWVAFIWCLSHRLELAVKDALSNWISQINKCLTNLFYLYKNSSKKLREVREMYSIICDMFEFENKQVKPHKATGSRWVDHHIKAMSNFVDKFGLYLAHFENIISDTTKRTDKATLEGKRREMCQADILLFSALFMDILEPIRNLSLITQMKDVNLLKSVNCINSIKQTFEKLHNQFDKNSASVFTLPSVKRVLSKVEHRDDDNYYYQEIKLTNFENAKHKLETEICDIVHNVMDCLESRFGLLSNNQCEPNLVHKSAREGDTLSNSICVILDTKKWINPENIEATVESIYENQLKAIEKVYTHFKQSPPLQNMECESLKAEFINLVKNTTRFYNTEIIPQNEMWRKIKNGEFAANYKNILLLVELCLCTPYSNATIERFFSYMKVVKNDWRNRLNDQNLESLMRIKVCGPTLMNYHDSYVKCAFQMWCNTTNRRVNQSKRKHYKPREKKVKYQRMNNEFLEEFLSDSSDGTDNENE